MRKIIIMEFITLDGIIQAPGGPEEDPSEDFKYGGWVAPYDDEMANQAMEKIMKPSDQLLGRKTFEIWENYWPEHAQYWPGINEVAKYALSRTRSSSGWNNSTFLRNIEDIRTVKASEGLDLHVWGSSELVQLLLEHDLVDEFWLMVHPVILGKGKRLFGQESLPRAFTLVESVVTGTGVIIAHYQRAGDVKTGRSGA